MKKRRRAYKKFDWRAHSILLLNKGLSDVFKKLAYEAIELTVLFGESAVAFKPAEVTIKAGLWTVTFPVSKPYLPNSEHEKERMNLSE